MSEAIIEELGIADYVKTDPLYQYELDLLKRESERRQDKVSLRGLYTLGRFFFFFFFFFDFFIFKREIIFYALLFAFLHIKPLLKRDLL